MPFGGKKKRKREEGEKERGKFRDGGLSGREVIGGLQVVNERGLG